MASARARVAASGTDPNSPAGVQSTAQSPEMAPHTLGDKLAMGAGDAVQGTGQFVVNMAPGDKGDALAGAENQRMANRESQWQANRAANADTGIEVARGVGAGLASAPVAALLPEAKGAGILRSIGTGILNGGVLSGMTPVTDANKGFAGQKAQQMTIGSGTGGLINGATNLLGKFANPAVDENVNFLRQRGVDPTLGQNIGPNAAKFESAMGTVNPFIGVGQRRAIQQFNKAAYNEAVTPAADAFGETVTIDGVGRKGIKAVGDYLSSKYEDILPRVALPIDENVLTDLGKIADEAGITTQSLSERVQRVMSSDILSRVDDNGVLTGQAFKDAEEALTKRAADYASGGGDDRTFSKALYDAADVLRDHLAASNPEDAAKLKAVNNGWAILTRLEKASGAAPATDNGVFTPAQLSRAVQTADNSVRHRQYVRGEALLQPLSDAGSQVLGNNYPNSGTVGRAIAGSVALGGGTAALAGLPTAATIGAASAVAYSPMGQRLIGSLANGPRGQYAPQVAEGLKQIGRYATPALIFGSRSQ